MMLAELIKIENENDTNENNNDDTTGELLESDPIYSSTFCHVLPNTST